MSTTNEEQPIDLTIVYDFKRFPEKHIGRCDNCVKAHIDSSVVMGNLSVNVVFAE
jgi:hypothetical protein